MTTKFIRNIAFLGVFTLTVTSCINDLEREPFYEVTSANVYNDFNNYKMILAKIYAGFALTGQRGPAGRPDVGGIDEGASNYLRQYWQLQELPTDEAIVAWNDPDLPVLNTMLWTESNGFIAAMYYRIFYQITLANEFIRETTEDKINSRGLTAEEKTAAMQFHAEARFVRALSYWHALDMFGSVPFITEADEVGAFFPEKTSKEELFKYIESELLAIEPLMVNAKGNEYGRADKAAVWVLLSKLYLNAEVYVGQARYTDAVNYSKKVIDAGYQLDADYDNLFLTDNHMSPEVIFPITFDGIKTKTYGGTTFLVNAPIGGSMVADDFGSSGGWGGLRTRKTFVEKFQDQSGNTDDRANFYTNGQELEINNISTFTEGYGILKFKNISSTGAKGSDPSGAFPDTDFPMFRLADVYLIYAEAVLRGGTGGTAADALTYVNALRQRAYKNTNGNIGQADLTLDFILDERARELYWEAHRRTDLIRFGKYTSGDYLWPWKGGLKEGRGVEPGRALYPLPSADVTANPNLEK